MAVMTALEFGCGNLAIAVALAEAVAAVVVAVETVAESAAAVESVPVVGL